MQHRRIPNKWPSDHDFRILSIDGGGIKGIFTACFLSQLEDRYLNKQSIAKYFDLICGTSTGGIIALALGSGITADEISRLYIEKGNVIFPYRNKFSKNLLQCFCSPYKTDNLQSLLGEIFKDKKLRESKVRLCIPSFEGSYSEVYIFKTPHHRDFKKDGEETMMKVALSTSSAPTYLRPFRDSGYIFVDGGVWANNPCMIGLTEALSSFDVQRENVKILSIGCGESPYTVKKGMITLGGIWHWREIIKGAMHLQSMNAIGQASLLIGRNRLIRVDIPQNMIPRKGIEIDDWQKSKELLPSIASSVFEKMGEQIKNNFLQQPVIPYKPLY